MCVCVCVCVCVSALQISHCRWNQPRIYRIFWLKNSIIFLVSKNEMLLLLFSLLWVREGFKDWASNTEDHPQWNSVSGPRTRTESNSPWTGESFQMTSLRPVWGCQWFFSIKRKNCMPVWNQKCSLHVNIYI